MRSACFIALSCLVACSPHASSPPPAGPPPEDGGTPVDGAIGDDGGTPPDAPSSNELPLEGSPLGDDGDAGTDTFRSNTPNASVSDVSADKSTGLTLISSNLAQDYDQMRQRYYRLWLGEVVNRGDKTWCDVHAEVRLVDSNGAVRLNGDSEAHAAPFARPGIAASVLCIAPRARGVLYLDPGFAYELIELLSITKVEIHFGGSAYADAVPHPDTPTLVSAKLIRKNGGWTTTGDVLESHGPIHGVFLDLFVMGPGGYITGSIGNGHPSTLGTGTTWPYETEPLPTPFHEYRAAFSFTSGALDGG